MVQQTRSNGKQTAKAMALVAAGRVELTHDFNGQPDGATVTNDEGFAYRVDFNLGGRPNCQCKGFGFNGWCKHLTAAYFVASTVTAKPEDDEPTDEEMSAMAAIDDDDAYAEMSQEEWDRLGDALLDAGLSAGTFESAAYALMW